MDHIKVRQLSEENRNLLISCFIRHQFFRISDHLIEILISQTQEFKKKVINQEKEYFLEQHQASTQNMLSLIDVIEDLEDLEVGEGCRRLIKNAIICWNYLYFSNKVLKEQDMFRQKDLLMALKESAILHWAHINLHGEYDFNREKLKDSQGIELKLIAKHDICKLLDRRTMENDLKLRLVS